MNSDELKITVIKWAEQIGHREAFKRLVAADISGTMATKLLAGSYGPTPSLDNANAILKEMAKDGISLAGGKAS